MHVSSPEEKSYLSLRVDQSQNKVSTETMKAGNKGQIYYSIKDSQTVYLTITPPTCSGKECEGEIEYVVMSANKLQDLYTQLVCPSSFFPSVENVDVPKVEEKKLKPTQNEDKTISFELVTSYIEFVGIKAIHKDVEVFYKPI